MAEPIPMRLPCPSCGRMHIDKGEFTAKPHHTHACQHCGMVWRPAVVETVGVQFLPGFKDDLGEAIIINVADLDLPLGEYLADTSADGYYLTPISSDFAGKPCSVCDSGPLDMNTAPHICDDAIAGWEPCDLCGQRRPHYHRDGSDGDEFVPLSGSDIAGSEKADD